MKKNRFILASIALEKNRWKPTLAPDLRLSEWLTRIAQAGFDGIELWEKHWWQAPSEDAAILAAGEVPIRIFNTYLHLDSDLQGGELERLAGAITETGAEAFKFNVGPPSEDRAAGPRLRENLTRLLALLPSRVRPRCECHSGTWLEKATEAREAFRTLGLDTEIIVHPFAIEADALEEWFTVFGSAITEVHVQCRSSGAWDGIANQPERSLEVVRELQRLGFMGDFVFEFTKGTGHPEEKTEEMWENVLADVRFLRRSWSGS